MRMSDRLFGVLGVGLLALAGWSWAPLDGGEQAFPRIAVRRLTLPTSLRQATLAPGENLTRLLARLGMPAAEIPVWTDAARRLLDVRTLPVGLIAEAVIDYHGILKAVRLTPDWRAAVVLERRESDISVRKEPLPVERELVVVRGTVHSSLFEAMDATGEQETLALSLAELFQWDIDFHREVKDGDTFSFLVQRVRSAGKTVAYGPILAAEYVNAGKKFTSVRYASTGSAAGYYDGNGRPLKKQFLRAPLRFSRITSRYSMSRLHPVLGRRMPHYGVDYGAPVGTPVMATADGVVISRGWHGGGGNAVEVRHADGVVTTYMHLSRFAPAARPGARVSQGEIIGYVGATGLATGPHLDYRVSRNGHWVNPLSVGGEPAPPLPARELPAFLAWARSILPVLGAQGELPPATAAALVARSPVHFDA